MPQNQENYQIRVRVEDKKIVTLTRNVLKAARGIENFGKRALAAERALDALQRKGVESGSIIQGGRGIGGLSSTIEREIGGRRLESDRLIGEGQGGTEAGRSARTRAQEFGGFAVNDVQSRKFLKAEKDAARAIRDKTAALEKERLELLQKERTQKRAETTTKTTTQATKSNTAAVKQNSRQQNVNKRAQEGVGKQSLASGKAFARQSQGLGGLVRVYATVAANVFALSSAYFALRNVADFVILEKQSVQYANNTGVSLQRLSRDLKETTGGLIDIRQATELATLGLAGGASQDQLVQITDIATKAAQALGRNVPEAVNRLVQAVIKGEPELVDEFGLILRVQRATDEYGRSVGKAASELTTWERQQAIMNQVIEQGTEKFGDANKEVNEFVRLGQSAIETIRGAFVPLIRLFEPIAGALADNASIILGIFAAFAASIFGFLTPTIANFGSTLQAAVGTRYTNLVSRATKQTLELSDAFDPKSSNFQRTFVSVAGDLGFLNLFTQGRGPGGQFTPRAIDGAGVKDFLNTVLDEELINNDIFSNQFKSAFPKKLYFELDELVEDALSSNTARRAAGSGDELIETILFGGRALDLDSAETLRNYRRALDDINNEAKRAFIRARRNATGFFGPVIRFNERVGIAVTNVARQTLGAYSNIFSRANTLTEGIALTIASTNRSLERQGFIVRTITKGIVLLNIALASTLRIAGTIIKRFAIPLLILAAIVIVARAVAIALGLWSNNLSKANKILEEVNERLDGLATSIENFQNLDETIRSGAGSMEDLITRTKILSNLSREIAANFTELAEARQLTQQISDAETLGRSILRVLKNIGGGLLDIIGTFGLFFKLVLVDIPIALLNQTRKALEQLTGFVLDPIISDLDRFLKLYESNIRATITSALATSPDASIGSLITDFSSLSDTTQNYINRLGGLSVIQNISADSEIFFKILEEAFLSGDEEVFSQIAASVVALGEVLQTGQQDLQNFVGALDTFNVSILENFSRLSATDDFGKILRPLIPLENALNSLLSTTDTNLADRFGEIAQQFSGLDQFTFNFIGLVEGTTPEVIETNIEKFREFTEEINAAYNILQTITRDLDSLKLESSTNRRLIKVIEDQQKGSFVTLENEDRLNKLRQAEFNTQNEILNTTYKKLATEVIFQRKVQAGVDDARVQASIETKILALKNQQVTIENQRAELALKHLIDNDLILLSLRKQRIESASSVKQAALLRNIYKEQATALTDIPGIGTSTASSFIETRLVLQEQISNLAIQEKQEVLERVQLEEKEIIRKGQLLGLTDRNLSLEEKQLEVSKAELNIATEEIKQLRERDQLLRAQQAANVRDIKSIDDPRFASTLANEITLSIEELEKGMTTVVDVFSTRIIGSTDKFFEEWINGLAEANANILAVLKQAVESSFNVFKQAILAFVTDQIKLSFRRLARALLPGATAATDLEKNTDQLKTAAENITTLSTRTQELTREISSLNRNIAAPEASAEAAAQQVEDTALQKSQAQSLVTIASCICRDSIELGSSTINTVVDNFAGVVNINRDINRDNNRNSTKEVGAIARVERAVISSSLQAGGTDIFSAVLSGFQGAVSGLNGMQKGGIVRNPSVIQFAERGPEAAVPLPDGRSIPVTLSAPRNNMGGGVNIRVNVNLNNNTTTTEVSGNTNQPSAQDAERLGAVISNATKGEILNQMRPGGLLYGVA